MADEISGFFDNDDEFNEALGKLLNDETGTSTEGFMVDLLNPDTWPECDECHKKHIPMELIYGIIRGELDPDADDVHGELTLSARHAVTIIYALYELKITAETDPGEELDDAVDPLMELIREAFGGSGHTAE